MARPRKPDSEKFVSITTYLPRARVEKFEQLAAARGVPLAVVVREYLDPAFRVMKNQNSNSSS